MRGKVIITAALSGAATFKNNNPSVPYTPEEFALEAEKAYRAGAAMVHVHAKRDDGWATHEVDRIRATHAGWELLPRWVSWRGCPSGSVT